MQTERRYPRVAIEQDGELEVRVGAGRVSVPVTIRSISCEGAGITFSARRPTLCRGATVTMRFRSSARDSFVLPGRVAWCAPNGERRGDFDVGVRFQLELAQNQTRQRYAHWIVRLIREAIRR
jgi:hypothetical protein